MAIRRPLVYGSTQFVFQDFPYCEDSSSQSRYVVAKYDSAVYDTVNQTFDYPSPSFRGGSIVARLDYTIEGKLITIDHWEVFWRDEWPLRLTVEYLANCLYSVGQGFTIRVRKDPYPFWASEWFIPLTNDPEDFLVYVP